MGLYWQLRRLMRHLELKHDEWVGAQTGVAPYVYDRLLEMARTADDAFEVHGRSYAGSMSPERRLVEEYGWLRRSAPTRKGFVTVRFLRARAEILALEEAWEISAQTALREVGLGDVHVGQLQACCDALRPPVPGAAP